ncbi:MAG: hypothetical protein A2V64_01850 [Bacteroidetes bacterium RBG_13_43_22]|nr:MAG: hypothetical protein A2V64_01850 [Bacteroidetes bacterium RBG_13_43_22]
MKKHFLSLIDTSHRKWTFSLLFIAIILVIAGILVGISDNPPGIAMVFFGMYFLFFSLIHPWRKPSYYLILSGICFGIIVLIIAGISIYALIFIKSGSGQTQGATGDFLEGFAILSTFFFCATGIIAGLSGAVIRAVQKKPQDN